jgi:hypothetical protein
LPQLPEGDGLAVLCPRAVRPAGAFVEGDTARYPSSEALDRVFCKICGTRLFSRRTNGTVVGVALAAFDDRNAFAPTEHIWVSEKIDWVRIDDGLVQTSGHSAAGDVRSLSTASRRLPSAIERLAGTEMVAA